MKKIIFIVCLFVGTKIKAQDTTMLSLRDSVKSYTYVNVYAILNSVKITPPMWRKTADSLKWESTLSISVYTSKADRANRKPELLIINPPALITDNVPTRLEILTRMRQYLK